MVACCSILVLYNLSKDEIELQQSISKVPYNFFRLHESAHVAVDTQKLQWLARFLHQNLLT